MADLNPYRAPQASVADEAHSDGNLRAQPRSVSPGQGLQWIIEGFGLFRQAPIPWIVIIVVAFVLLAGVGFIPFVGQLASPFLSLLLAGGVIQGCRALDRDEELTIGHLFLGFQTHLAPLVIVAALYIAAMIVMMILAGVVGFGSVMGLMRGGAGTAGGAASGVAIVVLVIMALMIPVAMAMWFAPSLIVLNDLAPLEAMKRSFAGCIRNILPLLLYLVIMFVLAFVASLPLLLGWLVLGPVFAGSIYRSYHDIFVDHGD
jgi:hypothetical protein